MEDQIKKETETKDEAKLNERKSTKKEELESARIKSSE